MITLSKAQLEASISQSQVIREEAEVEEIHAKNLSELRYSPFHLSSDFFTTSDLLHTS